MQEQKKRNTTSSHLQMWTRFWAHMDINMRTIDTEDY